MPSDLAAAQHWLREPDGAKQADAPQENGSAGEPGAGGEGADDAPAQLSLAEWKAQQIQKKALSTRERLRDEYAQQAARIRLGDRCEIGGYKGEVVFLGDEVEGLPGGFWVGIRYDEPVGKNDGTVKGQRLFHCSPNCGHIVRPDKVLEGLLTSASQSSKPRATAARSSASSAPTTPAIATPARQQAAPVHAARSSSDEEEIAAPRPHSMSLSSPSRGDKDANDGGAALPRARSVSPVRTSTPVLVTKEEPVNRRYEKWQKVDPASVIGTDPMLDEILPRHRTGLVYDTRMEAHCSPGAFHPEQPLRITAIFAALADQGLAQKCCRVPARFATGSELETVHTAEHVQNICNLRKKSQEDLNEIAAALDSVYLCPQSSDAALLASGSVLEATRMVCQGKIARACCVVRPPGHHALPSCAMGFCLFGNVAVAAKEARRRGWAQRILIFDWDVHHGNGTQKMFWEDDSVLVFSVHRYDRGNFYPGGPEGDSTWVGEGEGRGYNINVPWPKSGAGDPEYSAVVDQLLLPIAKEYKPDLVLISAGFDAAQGDPLGGCHITPDCYHAMTKVCKELASGKVVMALEGGYSLRATAQSMAACVAALLDPSKDRRLPDADGVRAEPASPPKTAGAIYLEAIEEARKVQAHFWKSVRKPDDVLDDSQFRSPTPPARPPSHLSRSAAAKGTGGWEVRDATPVGSRAAQDSSESKSVGGTPRSAARPWAARQAQATPSPMPSVNGVGATTAAALTPSPVGSSLSSEASSRGSSVSTSPAPTPTSAAATSTGRGTGSGGGTLARNRSANSVGRPNSRGSRGSSGSALSWPDWDDDSD